MRPFGKQKIPIYGSSRTINELKDYVFALNKDINQL